MKTVAVLMSTYNGENYIKEQIESIFNQKGVIVKLYVRDDGSKDRTLEILKDYNVNLEKGTNIGYIKSFMWLIKNVPFADYYALADQDDVWDEDKLYRAVQQLENCPDHEPALYSSNTRYIDACGHLLREISFKPNVSLESSFVKNFATGCTIVFNNDLRNYIKIGKPEYISCHDTWLCRCCLALNGNVVFDVKSTMGYRQHQNNSIGAPTSYLGKLERHLKQLFTDSSHSRQRTAAEILKSYGPFLNEHNKKTLTCIENHNSSLINKVHLILNKNFTCGNRFNDFLFKIAVLIGWI